MALCSGGAAGHLNSPYERTESKSKQSIHSSATGDPTNSQTSNLKVNYFAHQSLLHPLCWHYCPFFQLPFGPFLSLPLFFFFLSWTLMKLSTYFWINGWVFECPLVNRMAAFCLFFPICIGSLYWKLWNGKGVHPQNNKCATQFRCDSTLRNSSVGYYLLQNGLM